MIADSSIRLLSRGHLARSLASFLSTSGAQTCACSVGSLNRTLVPGFPSQICSTLERFRTHSTFWDAHLDKTCTEGVPCRGAPAMRGAAVLSSGDGAEGGLRWRNCWVASRSWYTGLDSRSGPNPHTSQAATLAGWPAARYGGGGRLVAVVAAVAVVVVAVVVGVVVKFLRIS